MSETTNKKSSLYWVHVLIVISLIFGFGYLPAPAPLTKLGMQVFGVFLGMLYGWCVLGDQIWPSLLGIVGLGCTEYTSISGAFSLFFSNTTTQQLLVVMIFLVYIDKCGLNTSMAQWVITRKFVNGRPWVFAVFLFVTAGLLSAFVSVFATCLVFWQIVQSCCKSLGYEKGDKYPSFLLMGIVVLTSYASALLPYKGAGLLLNGLLRAAGVPLTNAQYYILVVGTAVLLYILYILLGRFVLKPDVSKFTQQSDFFEKLCENNASFFRPEQKRQIIALVVFITSLFIVGLWPKTWPLYPIVVNFGVTGVVILLLVALIALRDAEGKPEFNFQQALGKVNWDLILLLGASFPVADAIKSDGTGFIAFCSGFVVPLLQDVGFMQFMIIISVFLAVASQFSHNLILQMVFIPMMAPFVAAAGFNPVVSSIIIFYAANFAFLTPGASAPAAMLFGNEWISRSYLYKFMLTFTVCGIAIMLAYISTVGSIVCPM